MPERLLYDALSSFAGGVNSDVEPLLLDRNTLSWMTNGTVRGGYAKPRPARILRKTVEATGLFQGAGYYRPDYGPSELAAQIGGRLFSFPVNGNTITEVDITVPGDPNDGATSQVWMFQAEKWLIVTDGSTKNPIFYDGVTSRRSYGPSVVLGVATAFNPATPPPIGETVQLTLNDPYEGPFNVPVLFNGEYYLVVSSTGPTPAYSVRLTAIAAVVGATVPSGSTVEIRPDRVSYNSAVGTVQNGVVPGKVSTSLSFAAPHNLALTDTVVMVRNFGAFPAPLTETWTVESIISPTQALLATPPKPFPYAGLLGTIPIQIVKKNTTDPTVAIGNTTVSFPNPPDNGTVDITLDTPYTGAAGQVVWIADDQYTIESLGGGSPSTTLYLQNLTDTSVAPYTNPSDVLSIPELPPGRMGAYGIGHVALNLIDGHSYIYGDVVGGPSGTPIYDYRDAVLKTTENDFLAGGGSFRIPNTGELITSFTIAPVLDASYGQGPLQIGTPISVYTCDIPTSPQAFEDLTNPILTQALIGKGPVSQNGTIIANSDTLYRSGLGFDSLIYGRRDFQTGWGNTPISTEVNRSIEGEDKSLISFTSAATFDNRLLATVQMASSSRGVYSQGIVALNFDPVSSLRGKAPSIWEGEWEDGNVMQYVTGNFSGVERCFQFAFNPETLQIEIWEQLRSDSADKFDNGTDRITWSIETPCIFHPDKRSADLPIVRLANGKIHLDEVSGTVDVAVQYRPDYSATWVDWHSFTVSSATPDGYKTPIGLGEPRVNSCAPENNRPSRSGRFFQLKITVTGQCKIMGAEFAACQEPTVLFPPPICTQ